jgi:hypothetical protein
MLLPTGAPVVEKPLRVAEAGGRHAAPYEAYARRACEPVRGIWHDIERCNGRGSLANVNLLQGEIRVERVVRSITHSER